MKTTAQLFENLGNLSLMEIVAYEVATSWWAQYISWPWLQARASRYHAWKAARIKARLDHIAARVKGRAS